METNADGCDRKHEAAQSKPTRGAGRAKASSRGEDGDGGGRSGDGGGGGGGGVLQVPVGRWN